MSKTYRSRPSSACYMRRMRHCGYRRAEAAAQDDLQDVPSRHENRIAARNARIPDSRDDFTVSSYRGQAWHCSDIRASARRRLRGATRHVSIAQLLTEPQAVLGHG